MESPSPVTLHLREGVSLEGTTLLEGFPSLGLVGSIVANYLVDHFDLPLVGRIDSPFFPTAVVVSGGEPLPPARIYSGRGISVVTSDFQPPARLVYPLARSLVEMAQKEKVRMILSADGIERPAEGDLPVFGVGSTLEVNQLLLKSGAVLFEKGIVTGTSALLLLFSKELGIPAASLLVVAEEEVPDARAAAKVLEVVDVLLGRPGIDIKPLYHEAENLERMLQEYQEKVRALLESREAQGPMYG